MERNENRRSEFGHFDLDFGLMLGLGLAIGAWAASCAGKSIVDRVYEHKAEENQREFQKMLPQDQIPTTNTSRVTPEDLSQFK